MADTGKADIFGKAVDTSNGLKEKRTVIRYCDTVAAKALDPYGVSSVADVSLETLWKIITKGDKFVHHFSNLAATEETGGDYRIGVGVSQYAETMLAVFKEIQTNNDLRKCVVPTVLRKADHEIEELKPHFEKLNAGKGSQGKEYEETSGSLKKRKREGGEPATRPTDEEFQNAAKAVHGFIKKGTASNARMLIQILSCGGAFYAAQCSDKATRAWTECKFIDEKTLERGVKARALKQAPSSSSGSKEVPTGGLFD